MKNLDSIADELFNKIRGRFPNITVGDNQATITNKPKKARFFEFDFAEGKKVNVNIDEDSLTIMYAQNLFSEQETTLKSKWFDFLKELRVFAKKRMLNFDTRDITKSNLDKRDYEYLSTEKQMSESKMYGTSRTSYQDIGTARLVVKHAGPVNHENAAGRTQNVHSIYIESANGERFKYPLRHMNGARAMAMHVSEGGNAYDDFGKHIVGLSEEMNKLRKFKTYMNRSSVMAEGLAGYMDVVNERLATVKKTVESLQRQAYYKEAFENFETTVLEEVPEDVSNSWIDELTIKQFNEELKGVFPYVYNLVKEANKTQELGPEDIVDEGHVKGMIMDMEEEAAGMSREEFIMKYGNHNADIWDRVNDEDYVDPSDMAPEAVIDPQTAYAEKLDSIISQSKHEQDPMEAQAEMWEQFKQCAADAASKGEKQFMFAGKKYKTKMSKMNAEKILGKRTDEDEKLKEALPLLGLLIPAAGAALRAVGPRVLPGMAKGAKSILGWSAKNPVKAGVAGVAAANPQDTANVIGGTVDAVKGGAELVGKASDAIDTAQDAIKNTAGKVADTADDLKDMAAGALDNIPNLDKVVSMARQYAIPAAVVVALLLGGYKVYKMMFGDDERAREDNADSQTNEGSHKQAQIEVQDWFEKFNEYKGTNGDDLAQGWIRATLDTGIMADAYEENEVLKFNKMKGYPTDELDTNWQQGDYEDFRSNKSGVSPITAGMFSTINAIMKKYDLDEEDIDDMSKADDPSYGKPDMRDNETTIDISPKGNGDELKQKNEIPLDEFIKSLYDYTTNSFPKGETAVLTSVQKQYGDEMVDEAQAVMAELLKGQEEEMARIQHLAGLR
tara:strand:+ start:4644 stop:7169 length:2526 start_codon:yes stop_codon:yes gene_type:complete